MAEAFSSLAEEREFVKRFGPAATQAAINGANGIPMRICRGTIWGVNFATGLASVQELGDPTVKDSVAWLPNVHIPSIGDSVWYVKFGTDGFIIGQTSWDIENYNFNTPRPGHPLIVTSGATGSFAVSNTAGVWGVMLTMSGAQVLQGRRYKISLEGGHSFVSGGSGFAAGNYWEFGVNIDENTGAGQIVPYPVNALKRVRSLDTVAQRWPIPVLTAIYEPDNDYTVDITYEVQKGSGASTVTTTVDFNGGGAPIFIILDDIGPV